MSHKYKKHAGSFLKRLIYIVSFISILVEFSSYELALKEIVAFFEKYGLIYTLLNGFNFILEKYEAIISIISFGIPIFYTKIFSLLILVFSPLILSLKERNEFDFVQLNDRYMFTVVILNIAFSSHILYFSNFTNNDLEYWSILSCLAFASIAKLEVYLKQKKSRLKFSYSNLKPKESVVLALSMFLFSFLSLVLLVVLEVSFNINTVKGLKFSLLDSFFPTIVLVSFEVYIRLKD